MISHIACNSAFGDDMAPRTRGGCCAAAPRADEPRESTRASASAETTGNGDGHERAIGNEDEIRARGVDVDANAR